MAGLVNPKIFSLWKAYFSEYSADGERAGHTLMTQLCV